MADIFISFKTADTPRVQAIYDGFRARGLTVFWSNDIPIGAPNYQAIIEHEILTAPVVVVVWTNDSVKSDPVAQECDQAKGDNKLFQIVLDDILPIKFPMGQYKAQKAMLLGWTGNPNHSEWIRLNSAIDARLGREPGAIPGPAPANGGAATVERPAWASDAGIDKFGRWADFALGGVTQRMRWIEPGTFTMGSPPDEPGRYDYEGPQHEVRLSQGFWLCDTPVTQALWTVAMGDNPSYFKHPKRPVEHVSWDDAQWFLQRINALVPGLDLVLPTEAQWEYACRAQTRTATYAGAMEILGGCNAPVLDRISWYSGNSGVGFELDNGIDSSGWSGKQYNHSRAGTHPVGSKLPNAWGLYDMLGNVFEWCADVNRSYTATPVTDPAGSLDSASRALRGGSWDCWCRSVRAARRIAYVRGRQDYKIGFRCASVRP